MGSSLCSTSRSSARLVGRRTAGPRACFAALSKGSNAASIAACAVTFKVSTLANSLKSIAGTALNTEFATMPRK